MSKNKVAEYGYIREAFMLRRYHTVGYITKEDTVGHHMANVIGILFYLFDDAPPLYLVKAALHHDVPELATGDIPATTKWQFPEISKVLESIESGVRDRQGLFNEPLEPLHAALLKYADMMDLCFKGVEELAQGNDSFGPIVFNGLVFVRRLLNTELKFHKQAHTLYELLRSNRFVNVDSIYNGEPIDGGQTTH
jgi:hypothetical protein